LSDDDLKKNGGLPVGVFNPLKKKINDLQIVTTTFAHSECLVLYQTNYEKLREANDCKELGDLPAAGKDKENAARMA